MSDGWWLQWQCLLAMWQCFNKWQGVSCCIADRHSLPIFIWQYTGAAHTNDARLWWWQGGQASVMLMATYLGSGQAIATDLPIFLCLVASLGAGCC